MAVPIAIVLGLGGATQATAASYSLGAAADYNVFVLENYDMVNTDVEGKLAVGGDLTAHTFGIGSKLDAAHSGYAAVVGNDVDLENGKVYGSLLYGGNAVVTSDVGFEYRDTNNVIVAPGELKQGVGIDFGTVGEALKQLSQSIYTKATSLVTNTTITHTFGNTFTEVVGEKTQVLYEQYGDTLLTTLTGTDPDLNVFHLSGDSFSQRRKFTIDAPETAQIIINVDGSTASIGDFGIYFGDKDCNQEGVHFTCRALSQNVLFNFYEARSIDIFKVGFMGSILAPHADIDFNNGHINGNLIAKSLAGTGESHLHLFNSKSEEPPMMPPVTPPVSTPEPATFLGLGLLGLGLAGVRSRASGAK